MACGTVVLWVLLLLSTPTWVGTLLGVKRGLGFAPLSETELIIQGLLFLMF